MLGMRNLRAVLLTSLLPSLALAATPQEEVLAMEARRISAFVQGDPAVLTSVLAEDLTYTHTNGQVETREQLLASISSGKIDYESIEPSDMQVRLYGNTAVVTGRADMKVKAQGNPLAFAIRFTAVWVRGEGGWRMAAWQSTRLP
jgi:ketosteroid isomerase-like protein